MFEIIFIVDVLKGYFECNLGCFEIIKFKV